MSECFCVVFFLMIRRPPRSTLDRSSAASDVYKRQGLSQLVKQMSDPQMTGRLTGVIKKINLEDQTEARLSLIHISEPTRPY